MNESINICYLQAKHPDTMPAQFVGRGTVAFDEGRITFCGKARSFSGKPAFKVIAFIGAIPAALIISSFTGIFPIWPLFGFMILALFVDALDRKYATTSFKTDSIESVIVDLAASRFLVVANRDADRLCIAWLMDSMPDAVSVLTHFEKTIPTTVTHGKVKGRKTS